MARGQSSSSLPILPLPKGIILFPGLVQRIPASATRPDIPALLASIYARAAADPANGDGSLSASGGRAAFRAINNVPVLCVPMASPYVGPQGQLLLGGPDASTKGATEPGNAPEFVAGKSTKADLFVCGVLAHISKVEGRDGVEFTLHVEGRSRARIDKITQEQPCFEGKATAYADDSRCFFLLLSLVKLSLTRQWTFPTRSSLSSSRSSRPRRASSPRSCAWQPC